MNPTALRHLAASVLVNAIKEAAAGDCDALHFLTTDRAQIFCDAVGLPPARLLSIQTRISGMPTEAQQVVAADRIKFKEIISYLVQTK